MGTAGVCLLVACTAILLVGAYAQEDNYKQILGMCYKFYEGQMSGNLPSWNQLLYSKPGGWKKNAHLNDGKDIGKDLSGGYYDAGDYLKISHPLAWGTTNLVFSMLEFKSAYTAAGQWDIAVRDIKWATDWLMKAHIKASDNPKDNVFVGQLSGKEDHHYFGRPEHAVNPRPIYMADSSTGGADLVGEYAAAFAAGAVLFRSVGQGSYAATLYKHAKQAFAFAEAHPNVWSVPPGVFQAYKSYWPDGYIAHLAWASAWMCKYDSSMCSTAERWFNTALGVNNLRYGLGYDWDSTMPGVAALVVSLNLGVSAAAREYLEGYILQKWQDTSNKCPQASYSTVCYTPRGMAYYSDWGTLRNNGNMMFIATLMGKYGNNKSAHICWARSQMRIITGTSTGKSYLIGYGPDQPKRPHHRQSACAAKYNEPCRLSNGGTCCAGESGTGVGGCCDETNFMASHPAQIVLTGALVGGPDQSDNYPDIRNDYQRSEVAFDYNAGFTGAVAGLAHFQDAGLLAGCPNSGSGGNNNNNSGNNNNGNNGGSGGSGGGNNGGSGGNGRPKRPRPGRKGCKRVAAWGQCGGRSACPSGTCSDAAWQGHCCASGSVCKRQNEWYWGCTPGTKSLSLPAMASIMGVSAPAASDAPVDVLSVAAPAVAAAGQPLELTASLTRSGSPVPGAEVEFVLNTAAANISSSDDGAMTRVRAVTDAAGVAVAVLPAESAGAVGSSSLLSAVTPDGKAVGVRGTIAVASEETLLQWQ